MRKDISWRPILRTCKILNWPTAFNMLTMACVDALHFPPPPASDIAFPLPPHSVSCLNSTTCDTNQQCGTVANGCCIETCGLCSVNQTCSAQGFCGKFILSHFLLFFGLDLPTHTNQLPRQHPLPPLQVILPVYMPVHGKLLGLVCFLCVL